MKTEVYAQAHTTTCEEGATQLRSRRPSVEEACLSRALAQLCLARTHERIEIPVPGGGQGGLAAPNLRYGYIYTISIMDS